MPRRLYRERLKCVASLALAILIGGCRRADPPELAARYAEADAAIRTAMADSSAWPSYGRDYTNQRYSTLAQITTANAAHLTLRWTYHTGIVQTFENSPLVVGGTMYVSTPLDHVVALDAATGRKKWEYKPELGRTDMCCGPNNRGVAVYDGRVYIGTLDAKLVALDTATGRRVWETQVADNDQGYSITHAPVAVDGKVIVGLAGAEYGIRGSVTAYDAATGARVWRFDTVPSPEEGGWWGKWAETDPFGTPLNRNIAQERNDSAKYADAWKRGGGSMWQAPAIDTAASLVIFSVDNVSPDLDSEIRPGDNLYGDCIVALDLKTGKIKWYLQEVPHDRWDYDAAAPVVLLDVKDSTGRVIPAAAQAGKTGWVYIVDRRTGAPIRRSAAFVTQQNMFTSPTRAGVHVMPGGNGGSEWSPAAFSPATGFMYVLGINEHDIYKLRPEKYAAPAAWLGGVWYSGNTKADNGTFTAIDVNTGRIAWQDTLPDPMIGGALATAGGLVFTGTKDKRLIAYDARSGHAVWTYHAKAGVNAPPVTYAVAGRQYVAVAAGGNFQMNAPRGDEVLAFALSDSTPQTPRRVSMRGTRH